MYLKFSSPSCGMCKALTKQLDQAGIKYETVDVSTDDGMAKADRYKVSHLPVMIEVDGDGNVINRYNDYGSIVKNIFKQKSNG